MITIESIIDNDEIFKNKQVSYDLLQGGNVNKTYKAICEEKAYVIRINGSQASFLGLDAAMEAEACNQANQFGVSPKVYNLNNAKEYLITDFFSGKHLSKDDMHKPEIMKMCMAAIKQIHDNVTADRYFTIFDLIDKYLFQINRSNVKLPVRFSEILNKYEKIKKMRTNDKQFGKTFCHNDLWENNILYDGKSVCIIDWEICGYGDAYKDIAYIPCRINASFEEEQLLLTYYFGYFEMDMWKILQDMKYICMMEELTWAFFHAGMPDEMQNNFNYIKSGNKIADILLSGQNHH